jgi:signal transduction protein with GAF and PtsI domain
MGVGACSIFLADRSAGQYLLIATDGLAPDAVGRTRIPNGEGLVGFVSDQQKPLNVVNAPDHRSYRVIPESGEGRFRAFLGVPIIHQGQVVGVLVAQRAEAASFTEDKSSFLVTIAAQLAGVINHAAMDGSVRRLLDEGTREAQFLQGIPGASGVAVGTIAVAFTGASLESVPDRSVADTAAEAEVFRATVVRAQEELQKDGARLTADLPAEEVSLAKGLEGLRDLPAQTPDGARVALYVNGGLLADITATLDTGVEGVGLYRTELAFMTRDSFPGENEQYRTYRKALMFLAPKPVTMRTLDVGGDKPLPYLKIEEANPFLGWRGIRVTLDHPEILLTQLRAMLRANAGLGNLRILLPMVSKVVEVDRAVELLDRAHKGLLEEGRPSSKPLLGVMIETPATVYQIAGLARRVDFLSIGTNDLTQYLLVVDRNNALVVGLFDSLHPAVLGAVNQVVQEAKRWGKPVGVCGEMAGDPTAALLLLGMGVTSLSMAGPDLPRVKQVIRSFRQDQAHRLLDQTLRLEDASEVRRLVTEALDRAGLGGLVRAGQYSLPSAADDQCASRALSFLSASFSICRIRSPETPNRRARSRSVSFFSDNQRLSRIALLRSSSLDNSANKRSR